MRYDRTSVRAADIKCKQPVFTGEKGNTHLLLMGLGSGSLQKRNMESPQEIKNETFQ